MLARNWISRKSQRGYHKALLADLRLSDPKTLSELLSDRMSLADYAELLALNHKFFMIFV